MEEKINAAVYIRVSTEDQAREGYSLDEQERRIKEYCKYKKLIFIKYLEKKVKVLKILKADQCLIKCLKKWKIINLMLL